METKQKLKDYGLWDWSHEYVYEDGQTYYYENVVCASDVAKFLKLPKTQQTYDKINEEYYIYEEELKDDEDFDEFMVDQYLDDATVACYEEY